jgi:c-di-GMP-binding flagellar brake protein YcgR
MSEYKPEKRIYKRVFFSNQDDLAGILKLSDNHEVFLTAFIKDLSEGGLGFAVKRDQKNKIIAGSQLTIKKIRGSEHLTFITDLKLEVIWVLDCDKLEHVGIGCRFLDIPQAVREKIRNYVKAWIGGGLQL